MSNEYRHEGKKEIIGLSSDDHSSIPHTKYICIEKEHKNTTKIYSNLCRLQIQGRGVKGAGDTGGRQLRVS